MRDKSNYYSNKNHNVETLSDSDLNAMIIAEKDVALLKRDMALAELDSTRTERDGLKNELKSLRNSKSWKITKPLRSVRQIKQIIKNRIRIFREKMLYSTNLKAHRQIISLRNQLTKDAVEQDPLTAKFLDNPPNIDISIATHNSVEWVNGFCDSLIKLNYPHSKIYLYFVYNNSNEYSIEQLKEYSQELLNHGFTVHIIKSHDNNGFGRSHNIAIKEGKFEYCLIVNPGVVFESDSIIRIVSIASADCQEIAAWELRQKPYEHAKFYDPVTGLTNWNSHACVLIRRSAFEKIGGYDKNLIYGEDVELSYRLRKNNYLLRYCPIASIYNYYDVKPDYLERNKYIGNIFANCYIRLKYGNLFQIFDILFIICKALYFPTQKFKNIRLLLVSEFLKLTAITPKILFDRFLKLFTENYNNLAISFRNTQYDIIREGCSIEYLDLPACDLPLVSIITRTYKGRELFLRQAMLSVAHQTYQNLEHIIVQDGGNCMIEVTQNINNITGMNVTFIGAEKVGRAAVGNLGLSKARGKYFLFLDDDDLLFSDHIEILLANLIKISKKEAVCYSKTWEVKTDYIMDYNKIEDYNEYFNMPFETPFPTVSRPFSAELLNQINYFPIQTILFPRELYEQRGGFDEDLDAYEDWLLWNRYAYKNPFIYIEKCTSMYRVITDAQIYQQKVDAFNAHRKIVNERIKNIYGYLPNQDIKMLFPIGHFYSPIVDTTYVQDRTEIIWCSNDKMEGIELNIEKQIMLLKELKPYVETINYPITQPIDPTTYYYSNGSYPSLDAQFLYAILRYLKPKNMIEVGSGFSSLITADVNRNIFNNSINFICIEPYPPQFIINGVCGISKLLVEKLENISLELFNILDKGDILFIDTSHVAKTGSDVNYLFFEILPRLKVGVIVHIHDIFLPDEYPKRWVIDEGRNWNEQYILRAFLQNNNEWEVIWAAYFMDTRFTKNVQDVFQSYPQLCHYYAQYPPQLDQCEERLGEGSSFWIKKRAI